MFLSKPLLYQNLDQFVEGSDYFLTDISLLSFVHKRFEQREYDVTGLVELAGNTPSQYTLPIHLINTHRCDTLSIHPLKVSYTRALPIQSIDTI